MCMRERERKKERNIGNKCRREGERKKTSEKKIYFDFYSRKATRLVNISFTPPRATS